MLSQKIALVTGASGGIGQAIVRSFMDKGAFVIATDKQLGVIREWEEQSPDQILGFEWDLTNWQQWDRNVADILACKGRVDILVNNAGVMSYNSLEEVTLEEWNTTHFINVTIPLFLSQKLVLSMKKYGYGRIVNVSSVAGKNTASISGAAYSVSKAGLNHFTRRAAYEWGPYGITVNAVAPGPVQTRMAATFSKEKLDQLLSTARIRRMGRPEEIAEMIAFLSSEAGGYITGEIIDINGGSFID